MYIQEIADHLEIPVSTIRYYERKNLITEVHFTRQPNNYRVYNDKAVERIKLIQAAQLAGITLREMREYIDDWEQNSLTIKQKQVFFTQKLLEIEHRIVGLNAIRQYVLNKLEGLVESTDELPKD